MEREVVLGLETRDVVRRHAGEARFRGQVEEDRQVRAEALRCRLVERPERFEGTPAPKPW